MVDGPVFEMLDAGALPESLRHLFSRTARERGRIEIVDAGGESCVMISKAELDGLEKALEILSKTDEARAMLRTVRRVAAPLAV